MKQNSKKYLFYVIMWIGVISTLIAAYITRGKTLMNLLFCQETQSYMDFFESIVYGRSPYDSNASYPPLAYVIFGFFGRFLPVEIRDAGGYAVRESQAGLFLLGVFLVVGAMIFSTIVIGNQKLQMHISERLLFLCTISCSLPMLFLLERANIIFYVMLFVYIFLLTYESENIIIKHISYICLGIAAGIKIYPALLGILVIRRKNIKEILWCIFYGVSFFFLPFTLFGGFQGISKFVNNLLYSLTLIGGELGYGYKVNLTNTFGWMGHIFNVSSKYGFICSILVGMITVFGIIVALFGKFDSKWKKWMIPLCFMIILPGFSFIYSLVLLIPPLMAFLCDKKQKYDCLYAILFALIFSPMIIVNSSFLDSLQSSYYQLNWSTVIESFSLLIILLLIIMEGIVSIFKAKGKRNEKFSSHHQEH